MKQRRTARAALLASLFMLALSACAPAPTMDKGTAVQWNEAEQTAICQRNPQVTEKGNLLWQPDGYAPAPFQLNCPNLSILAQDNKVIVKATDLPAALNAFHSTAYLLTYFAELGVHLTPDWKLTVDSPNDIPEAIRNRVNTTKITVTTQDGQKHPLLLKSVVMPMQLNPSIVVTIDVQAAGDTVPWPTVTLDGPNATVTATLP